MNVIDYSILSVISYYPCTGYDIKIEFEHQGAGLFWGVSFGSIYPRLKKLEDEGYIYTYEAEQEGRQRKLYELTAKGWRATQKWLKTKAEYPTVRDELFIRPWTPFPEERSTFIAQLNDRKSKSQELLDYVQRWPANGISSISEYSMLALEYAQMKLEAELQWIDKAIQQLEGPPHPPVQDPNDLIPKQLERRKKAFEDEKSGKKPSKGWD